jgi:hypothetical protein
MISFMIQHSLEDTVGNMLVMARHVFMPFIFDYSSPFSARRFPSDAGRQWWNFFIILDELPGIVGLITTEWTSCSISLIFKYLTSSHVSTVVFGRRLCYCIPSGFMIRYQYCDRSPTFCIVVQTRERKLEHIFHSEVSSHAGQCFHFTDLNGPRPQLMVKDKD